MAAPSPRRRRGRILISLLALLFAVGVVPLLWTSYRLVSSSRDSLENNQREMQIDKARILAAQVALYVESLRPQVVTIARTLEVEAGTVPFGERVARIRDQKALERYLGTAATSSTSASWTPGASARSRGWCSRTPRIQDTSSRASSAGSTAPA